MTLKHDAAGFLIGEPLDLGKAVSILETIQADVRAMRQALAGAPSSTPRAPTKIDRAPVTPMRHSGLNSSTISKPEIAAAVNKQVAAMVQAASKQVAVPQGRVGPTRDARGRFVGASSGLSGSGAQDAKWTGSSQISSDGFVRRMAAAVKEEVSGAEDADPTVKAYKEVAEPLKRGFTTLLGDRDEDKKSGWFRRIWGEIKGMRVEQTAYEKATIRGLKNIEEKPTEIADGGGSWGGMLLTAVTRLGPLLIPIATGVAAMAAGFALLMKLFPGSGSGTADKDAAEDIKNNVAEPLKDALKHVGIDKDADIEAIREKNRREQNGADEYERMDRARAAVAVAGIDKASPDYGTQLNLAYKELERQDDLSKKGRLARAWDGIKSFGNKKKDAAFRTGAQYAQGNIDGLDDAHTRALVASTAETESSGGKLDIVNKQGYMGRYQAGASWLADAGLIRGGSSAVKAAMKADGAKSEWQWASAGGMSKFLNSSANWVDGMSKEKYLASADIQDSAFKVNSDRAYAELVKRGAIQPGDSQEKISGLLKARHLAGIGGAIAVAGGKSGPSDANGTSARKYFNDLANDPAGFAKAYSVTTQVPQIATVSLPSMPAMPSAPIIPDAPVIQMPLSSGDTGRNITVTPAPAEHGQDLSNRRMAHIVTGGYSGA